ncbi:deoxyribose-phosphate aldolase [Rhizosphaericola mali]|uniref:Deoxyribose-phosphate aldolase n=1 Tax=Rhizosphaericola mali TaxID=2545455 RepID=A0A5P2G267_9BACT|nr:deoxyribose-phosphate aldolase [Rhizosphaericola mali]QES89267.1 deoxyribose-phosphate aldolase [Rhizosphaericola mali]
MAQLVNHYIDHTILKPTTLVKEIEQLCAEAMQYNFAAVCVPPNFVKKAKELTKDSEVKVATVIGFPFGYSAIEAKVAETVLAMVDGADELDIVINLIALKNNDWEYLANEINHLAPLIQSKRKAVKIIIESGILTDEEIIKCCTLYTPANVDFMKTSTGYAEVGATMHAVELMRKNLPENIQIKASGGIRDLAFAQALIAAGATRLGCSASVKIVNEQN